MTFQKLRIGDGFRFEGMKTPYTKVVRAGSIHNIFGEVSHVVAGRTMSAMKMMGVEGGGRRLAVVLCHGFSDGLRGIRRNTEAIKLSNGEKCVLWPLNIPFNG